MEITPIRTRILKPPKDDLLAVVNESLPKLKERSVVVVSSKVVAIWQGRCMAAPKDIGSRNALKEFLAMREAQWYLPRDEGYPFTGVRRNAPRLCVGMNGDPIVCRAPLSASDRKWCSARTSACAPGGAHPSSKEARCRRAQRPAVLPQGYDAADFFTRLFTVYEGVLGSSAGIDESNGDGFFVLLPENCDEAAERIRAHIKKRDVLKEVGVVISDSCPSPMRNGATAVALGHSGFEALYDYRGKKDIFGRKLKFERMNVADSLATAANIVIGEGGECSPLAVCEDLPHITGVRRNAPRLCLGDERRPDLAATTVASQVGKCVRWDAPFQQNNSVPADQCPEALVPLRSPLEVPRGWYGWLCFTFTEVLSEDSMLRPKVSMEDDVFAQFFMPKEWKRGGKQ